MSTRAASGSALRPILRGFSTICATRKCCWAGRSRCVCMCGRNCGGGRFRCILLIVGPDLIRAKAILLPHHGKISPGPCQARADGGGEGYTLPKSSSRPPSRDQAFFSLPSRSRERGRPQQARVLPAGRAGSVAIRGKRPDRRDIIAIRPLARRSYRPVQICIVLGQRYIPDPFACRFVRATGPVK